MRHILNGHPFSRQKQALRSAAAGGLVRSHALVDSPFHRPQHTFDMCACVCAPVHVLSTAQEWCVFGLLSEAVRAFYAPSSEVSLSHL